MYILRTVFEFGQFTFPLILPTWPVRTTCLHVTCKAASLNTAFAHSVCLQVLSELPFVAPCIHCLSAVLCRIPVCLPCPYTVAPPALSELHSIHPVCPVCTVCLTVVTILPDCPPCLHCLVVLPVYKLPDCPPCLHYLAALSV